MALSFGLVIPTRNALPHLEALIRAIRSQEAQPQQIVFIDSSSEDGTKEVLQSAGFNVISIQRSDFDHGRTRQFGLDLLGDVEVCVFLTQDAYLAEDGFSNILNPFSNAKVGAAYGRQIPHSNATPIGAHARIFNYPSASMRKSARDIGRMGIKAAFISNSFAAYRLNALRVVGGFPTGVIFGEDMITGARLVLKGYEIAYEAAAVVHHSHDYTMQDEFRRYFDVGVLHSNEPWLLEHFGSLGGEGVRFVKSELQYLWRQAPFLIPEAACRTAFKLFAYRIGRIHGWLPTALRRRLSLNKAYWSRTTDVS
jgi:rhamnosyltransferase